MNIYEKMSAITAELAVVAKNLSVGEGKSAYNAVGEADVLAAVKPLEIKHKVYSYPVSRKVIDTAIMTTTTTYKETTKESNKLFMRLETVYRFVNTEDPTEFIDVTTYGDGVDSQDKAPGKAMTYADKYALLKAYKIITGEDPDQHKSEEGSFIKPKAQETTYGILKPNEELDNLASKLEKQNFLDLCVKFGVDYKQIAKQAGAVSMATMTKEQHGKCLIILKEIEDAQ